MYRQPFAVSAQFMGTPTPIQANLSYPSPPALHTMPVVCAPFQRLTAPLAPGQLLSLTCGVPSACMPSLGVRTYGGAMVSDHTVARAEAIIKLGAPTASQDLSIHRGFSSWRVKQGMQGFPLGQTLAVFGAYLEEADLKHSTIVEYVQSAHKMCRRDGEVCADETTYRLFLKGAQLLAANDKPDHAIDVSMDRIMEILAKLDRATHDEWRFTIWMMVTCGARMSDLRRLKSAMIRFIDGILRIFFRVTKTSRDGSESYEVTVEQNVVLPFEAQWRAFLAREMPFHLKADSVNKVLHRFGFPETTYSFRRFFIQATIARFTDQGHTEWCRVIEITGHQQGKTVRAKYALHVDDPVPGEAVPRKRERTVTAAVNPALQAKEKPRLVMAPFLQTNHQSKLDNWFKK